MAVDTRRKRGSVHQLPPLTIHPAPDGTIDAQDRMVASWLYGGIAPAVSAKITADAIAITLFIDKSRGITSLIDKSRALDSYIDKGRSVDLER